MGAEKPFDKSIKMVYNRGVKICFCALRKGRKQWRQKQNVKTKGVRFFQRFRQRLAQFFTRVEETLFGYLRTVLGVFLFPLLPDRMKVLAVVGLAGWTRIPPESLL